MLRGGAAASEQRVPAPPAHSRARAATAAAAAASAQFLERAAKALYYRALLNRLLMENYNAEAPGGDPGVALRRPPATALASFPAYAAWAIERRLGLPLRLPSDALAEMEKQAVDAVRPSHAPRARQPAPRTDTMPPVAARGGAHRRGLPPCPGARCGTPAPPGPPLVCAGAGLQRQAAPRI